GGEIERALRPAASAPGHRPKPRIARGDDRKLRQREQAVEHDQREDQDDVEPGDGGQMVAHRRRDATVALPGTASQAAVRFTCGTIAGARRFGGWSLCRYGAARRARPPQNFVARPRLLD